MYIIFFFFITSVTSKIFDPLIASIFLIKSEEFNNFSNKYEGINVVN